LNETIENALKSMRENGEYHLHPNYRFAIYQAFEPGINLYQYPVDLVRKGLGLPQIAGYFGYAQLAILTAQYVLPVWDSIIPSLWEQHEDKTLLDEKDLPHRILKIADDVLFGRIETQAALVKLDSDFYYALGAIASDVPKNAWYAVNAAYNALYMVLGGQPFKREIKEATVNDIDVTQLKKG
jgi:hypothetical protein